MSYQEQMSELWQELSALKYRMMTMYSKTVEGVPGAPHDEFLAARDPQESVRSWLP